MNRPRHVLPVLALPIALGFAAPPEATDIGQRRELFVDARMIESLDGAELESHRPRPDNVALRFDDPWDGPYAAYVTVFQDDELFRMYYRGWSELGGQQLTCYAESADGIQWKKPSLGLVEHDGSTDNNIILKAAGNQGTHNFAPFKDARPGVPDDERYKALGGQPPRAFVSSDAIRWRPFADKPVLNDGAFDSQNLAFWDTNRDQYAAYFRIFINGVRSVARATSDDFVNWSETTPVDFGDAPPEHYYTNATVQYPRAPHYYLMFPKRFIPGRKKLPEHAERGISEGVLLSSRDGERFDLTFPETWIRPGRDRLNWGDRSLMTAWGVLATPDGRLSVYVSQHYRYPSHHLLRYSIRPDGFASASADRAGGELITKPLRFEGDRLELNVSTAASGWVQVEIQEPSGAPIPGFTLEDAPVYYGDELDAVYTWKSGPDVSKLAGKPVRLRFVLKDADIYSYKFTD